MRKVKNAFLILLAALLVAAGGLLPMAAARLQDKATIGTAKYEDIEALQLKLELEEDRAWLSIFEKIQLMTTGVAAEITADMTKIKEEQVVETVVAGLDDYIVDCLILVGDMYYDTLELEPILLYDENDPTRFNYYWWVTMSLESFENDSITVILDDETGEILALECLNLPSLIEDSLLVKFEDIVRENYFGNLGIMPTGAKQIDVESVEADSSAKHYVVCYQCINTLYGEINIEICVRSNGFYILPV